MLFGRVRPSSITSLQMEAPPPKIIKHDSLSIYESTLLKLKQGSHRNPDGVMAIEECMTSEADCAPLEDPVSTKEQASRNMSILHFFSKCKTYQQRDQETMVTEPSYSSSSCSSSSTSPTSSR